MTGSRLYDAYRVLSATRQVLDKTCKTVQRDLKLHAESSSLVRAVYESSPVFRLVFGNNYRANPRPHPHSFVVKKAPRPAGQGPTIAGTIFDAGHRPTVSSTVPADVAGKREYSTQPELIGAAAKKELEMDTSPVPSTRIGRFLQYGSLATGLGLGALSEGFKRLTRREPLPTREALLLTPENTERMVQKLARMRGAVLKLGQLLSFQQDLTGTAAIPPELQTVLARVQNAANYMPAGQLERVMSRNLSGAPGVGNPQTWKQDLFASFEDYPIAAASIGQVHGAVLLRGYDSVAIKVQYPGVADSIDSDLNNLQMLLNLFAGAKGAAAAATKKHLSKIIATARTELKWECDYLREAQAMERFRELLADDPSFVVPRVHHEVSTARVLTMQRMRGIELTKLLASPSSPDAPVDPARTLSQDERDWLGTKILELVLKEIAVFKYMQTDPNWANFLYNRADGTIELLDFGAARGYTDEFSSQYVNMLRAAVAGDRPLVLDHSRTLGYVTGDEAPGVLATHVDMQTLLVAPFTKQAHDRAVAAGDPAGRYDFKGHGDVTRRIMADVGHAWGANAAYAPPEESFGIQRKLSGVYMLCSKLEARVPAYQMFNEIVGGAVL